MTNGRAGYCCAALLFISMRAARRAATAWVWYSSRNRKQPTRTTRIFVAHASYSGLFCQLGNLRIQMGERAIELISMAGILTCLQVFLDAGAGKQEHLAFAA